MYSNNMRMRKTYNDSPLQCIARAHALELMTHQCCSAALALRVSGIIFVHVVQHFDVGLHCVVRVGWEEI